MFRIDHIGQRFFLHKAVNCCCGFYKVLSQVLQARKQLESSARARLHFRNTDQMDLIYKGTRAIYCQRN